MLENLKELKDKMNELETDKTYKGVNDHEISSAAKDCESRLLEIENSLEKIPKSDKYYEAFNQICDDLKNNLKEIKTVERKSVPERTKSGIKGNKSSSLKRKLTDPNFNNRSQSNRLLTYQSHEEYADNIGLKDTTEPQRNSQDAMRSQYNDNSVKKIKKKTSRQRLSAKKPAFMQYKVFYDTTDQSSNSEDSFLDNLFKNSNKLYDRKGSTQNLTSNIKGELSLNAEASKMFSR